MRASTGLLLALAGIVVLVAALGGGVYLYAQHQSDLQTGHWSSTGATGSGQVPDGSFGFTSLSGQVIYTPPSNPPIPVTWQRYQNADDGYSLETASNWLAVNTPYQGHAQWQLCPPDTQFDTQQPGPPPCVSYGWVQHHDMPSPSDRAVGTDKAITVDGVTGTLYTESSMGQSVTAVFPYRKGYLYLAANADSDAAMYVFQHLLDSLTFN